METSSQLNFSRFDIVMNRYRQEIEDKTRFSSVSPFADSEIPQDERLRLALKDFWQFDQIYFTKEMYSDGYSAPSRFHKEIIRIASRPGIQVVLGPRKHGKTATAKKFLVWLLLSGKVNFAGTLSQTLTTSRNILTDIFSLIADNRRILHDFAPEFDEANQDQLTFSARNIDKKIRLMAFSEGRSVRGATRLFDRPQFILCDDLETRQSPLGDEQTTARLRMLSEAFHSLSSNGTILVLGNNFDERCALNKLLQEQNDGILPAHIKVHVFRAWDNHHPLWRERFPARSADELRQLLKVSDQAEWLAEFQQTPTAPDGFIFNRLNPLPTYSSLPADARGVIYCDPNLAKKGRGDSTAIVSVLYSPNLDKYYVEMPVCRSFSDSNALLDAVLKMRSNRTRTIGFDGHVSQESTWTNNVRNYCKINNTPYPPITYCRYNTDELAKNIQGSWNEGRILLPENISQTDDGKRFLTQIFAFAGKKKSPPRRRRTRCTHLRLRIASPTQPRHASLRSS
ncbi:MAG TPA: hypothetical protein PLU67_02570 [Candidatus Kapabacteria bacterium]|nr:hypothetical protein [Candidatus Kapabacteria bacterium]HPP38665.1 hypothetical protein [Candidatus Kapabacteria bacterium]